MRIIKSLQSVVVSISISLSCSLLAMESRLDGFTHPASIKKRDNSFMIAVDKKSSGSFTTKSSYQSSSDQRHWNYENSRLGKQLLVEIEEHNGLYVEDIILETEAIEKRIEELTAIGEQEDKEYIDELSSRVVAFNQLLKNADTIDGIITDIKTGTHVNLLQLVEGEVGNRVVSLMQSTAQDEARNAPPLPTSSRGRFARLWHYFNDPSLTYQQSLGRALVAGGVLFGAMHAGTILINMTVQGTLWGTLFVLEKGSPYATRGLTFIGTNSLHLAAQL